MKHLPFTNNIGQGIVSLLQKQWKRQGNDVGYSVIENTIHADPCYQPTAGRLGLKNTDHFGLLFQGYSGSSCVQEHGPEAKEYLSCLLDPNGPFKGILPYLWHSTADEIIADKGFVFKDLDGKPRVNLGLLWTFAQASRLMYENPGRMKVFQYAIKTYHDDKPLSLLLCFILTPWEFPPTKKTTWKRAVGCHGEPLGRGGTFLAGRFLTGNILPHNEHSTSGSWQCFGRVPERGYPEQIKLANEQHLLSEWVTKFKEANV